MFLDLRWQARSQRTFEMNDFETVNRILGDWNPIGVPNNLKLEEYQGYVSKFIKARDNLDAIIIELEKIALDIGGYSADNLSHRKDIEDTAKVIFKSLSKQ